MELIKLPMVIAFYIATDPWFL